jgi:hypothetical protein
MGFAGTDLTTLDINLLLFLLDFVLFFCRSSCVLMVVVFCAWRFETCNVELSCSNRIVALFPFWKFYVILVPSENPLIKKFSGSHCQMWKIKLHTLM